MRKSLFPMLVSLALCGAATTALVISSAHAQPEARNPVMVTPPVQVAQNEPPPDGQPPRDLRRRDPAELAARMKTMCQDAYAHQAGDLTYLQTRLQLTASQQSAFQRWSQARLAIAKHHADECAQRPQPERRARGQMPSPADMMGREEDRLKQRLADIEAERPALDALYNTLSPQQRVELVRASRQDRGDMRRHMFADARGGRGPMGGPMGRPPFGPDAPPPATR